MRAFLTSVINAYLVCRVDCIVFLMRLMCVLSVIHSIANSYEFFELPVIHR